MISSSRSRIDGVLLGFKLVIHPPLTLTGFRKPKFNASPIEDSPRHGGRAVVNSDQRGAAHTRQHPVSKMLGIKKAI